MNPLAAIHVAVVLATVGLVHAQTEPTGKSSPSSFKPAADYLSTDRKSVV